jgi:putative ABC transport system permease protein
MDSIVRDFRFAFRGLVKHPGFTAIAVIILALGIAATTAIFSVVNGVLLRPLPYTQPEQLLAINEVNPQQGPEPFELSYLNWLDLRQQSKSFEDIAAVAFSSNILKIEGEPERVQTLSVSANLFPLLRAHAAQGRTFLADDDKPGANRVVVVSHRFWQRHFANQSLNNQGISLDDHGFAVVGVMPAGFQFPDDKIDLWTPLGPDSGAKFFQNRAVHFITGLGRTKSGVSRAQASTELTTIFGGIQQAHAKEDAGHSVSITPLQERMTGDVKPALYVLLGAVIFVLLIGCANVGNLQWARAASRGRETAIRIALGASRWRVIRQSLAESLLLACLGGGLGFLLAMWLVTWLLLHLPEGFPRASEIGMDAAVFAFTFAVSLLTGLVFGLAPAIQAARSDVNDALKSGGKGSINSGARLRRVFVVVEVALSLMLFIGAGLLIKSFWRLTNVNPGFQSDHLLTLHVSLPEQKYTEDAKVIEFFRYIPEQLSTLPGVKAVSAVNRLPISGGDPHGELTIEGRTFGAGEAPGVSYRRILPNYFRAMGIPLLQGREFDDRDRGGKPDVVIVNQKMAQRYWPGGDAIGKRIKIGPAEHEPWVTIVGVVGNVNHIGLDAEPDFASYEPHAKRPWSEMTVLVRTVGDPLSLAGPVQQELKNAEKDILIEDVVSMNRRLDLSVAPQRLNVVLLATFAFIALVLAMAGIYGVMAHSVAQRTPEIGLRMALGAQLGDVMKMVLSSGMWLALIGIAIGLVGAFFLTGLMSKLLFGVMPTDAVTFASVAGILFVVALLACYIPARRATKVDPTVALRYE